MTKKLVIIGAGGHARMIASSILKSNVGELRGFINDYKKSEDEKIFGKEIYYNLEDIEDSRDCHFIVGIGDNQKRKDIFEDLKKEGCRIATVIDRTVIIEESVIVGEGNYIAPGAIINTGAEIGENTIINSGAIIEHDCGIGKNCHIAPGCRIAGGVKIGNNSFIGIGATVKDKINIGKGVIIGAGSVVINDIGDDLRVVGVPAKKKI